MKAITSLLIFCILIFTVRAQENQPVNKVIAKGQMPCISKDKNNHIHLVYGSGDSIMYMYSSDGKNFTSPELVAILPKLFSFAMRGPQIAAVDNGILITACTQTGNIFSFKKDVSGKWSRPIKINDAIETAKEGLIALNSDGLNAYAVWLGVKSIKGQNVYGARSVDGGSTWSKNIIVYASPDSTVCECCKPSVAISGGNVYVMFRNWLKGSRDMYLITSTDGGNTFQQAEKLGMGSWKLNGCPMDGGGLVINENGTHETIWRREGKIYTSTTGGVEKEMGEGRSGSVETINNKNIYAWTNNGEVVFSGVNGKKTFPGKGSLPLLKVINKNQVLCVWEYEKQIHASLLEL